MGGLFEKTVAAREAGGSARVRIDRFGRQRGIEQLAKHATVAFDELGVYARNVHLAEVDARPRVVPQPVDDVEEEAPVTGQLQSPQRSSGEPCEQGGLPGLGQVHEAAELGDFGTLSNHRHRVAGAVDPRLVRKGVDRQRRGGGIPASRCVPAARPAALRSRHGPRRNARSALPIRGRLSARRFGNSASPVTSALRIAPRSQSR